MEKGTSRGQQRDHPGRSDKQRRRSRSPTDKPSTRRYRSHKSTKLFKKPAKKESSEEKEEIESAIQVTFDDREGRKITIPCLPDDKISDIKKMVASLIGTRPNKFTLKRGTQILKDQGTLDLYEIHDHSSVEIKYS